ncbi:MAG: hypothetical protein M3O94_02870, partial [Actinomycetota bacterium]|nr:hypothetical protein [Actinomycetota bacterium]
MHGSDFGMLLDWKWGYGDGHLGRWDTSDLGEFLLGWCPRKLMASPDILGSVPLVATLAMSFLAERSLLTPDSDPVDTLTTHGRSLVQPFLAAMSDPANFGMSKAIFTSMGVEDPSALNPAEIERVIAEFNAQPMSVRKAVTDPALSSRTGPTYAEPTRVGPIRMPGGDAVRASAEESPALEGFVKFSDYFAAPGKVLTAKGNLKLVDARALVEVLGTGDVEATTIGDRVWRRQSATEFRELDHWQWWAREAGVVRTKHSRLVSVAAWRKRLRSDPVSTLHKAVEVLFEYGLVTSYRVIAWPLDQALDVAAAPTLARLAQNDGPEEYDDLLAAAKELLETHGVRALYPGHADGAVDDLLTMLERAGLVTQHGVTRTESEFSRTRTGGTVAVTPFGTEFAVGEARRLGIEVLLVRDPRDLSVDDLVSLAEGEEMTLEDWWDDAADWLDAQPERDVAVEALLRTLSPLYLALALTVAPERLWPGLVPVLRDMAGTSEAAPTERSAAALWWLLAHEPPVESEFAPEYVFESTLIVLELIAEGDDEMVIEMLGNARDVDEQLQMLAAVARHSRPRGLRLLEAVGRSHPDKRVSKFARKESFRLRSKLASASSSGGATRR